MYINVQCIYINIYQLTNHYQYLTSLLGKSHASLKIQLKYCFVYETLSFL